MVDDGQHIRLSPSTPLADLHLFQRRCQPLIKPDNKLPRHLGRSLPRGRICCGLDKASKRLPPSRPSPSDLGPPPVGVPAPSRGWAPLRQTAHENPQASRLLRGFQHDQLTESLVPTRCHDNPRKHCTGSKAPLGHVVDQVSVRRWCRGQGWR